MKAGRHDCAGLAGSRADMMGARALLRHTRRRFPFIEVIYADGGYQGPKMAATVAKTGVWRIEIVKRNDVPRFEVLPKRWIVERTFAWLGCNRRLTKDLEQIIASAEAWLMIAGIQLLSRRIPRP